LRKIAAPKLTIAFARRFLIKHFAIWLLIRNFAKHWADCIAIIITIIISSATTSQM
jgi:predicted benzoate:H+ symporter BenE